MICILRKHLEKYLTPQNVTEHKQSLRQKLKIWYVSKYNYINLYLCRNCKEKMNTIEQKMRKEKMVKQQQITKL